MGVRQWTCFIVLAAGLLGAVMGHAGEVRIVTTEKPPANYTSGGKLTGMTTDIVEEIKKYLKTGSEIEVLPWARAYDYAKTFPNVVVFTAAKTRHRIDHGFHFIGPVTTRKHVLFKKKGASYRLDSLEDIVRQKLVVGSVIKDWRSGFFKGLGARVEDVTSHELNVRKLIRGRVHLWALSNLEAPLILKETGVSGSEIEIAYVFKEGASYIMLSRGTDGEIVERWRHAFAEIRKTDFFKRTARKWSGILNENIRYKPEKGFYIVE